MLSGYWDVGLKFTFSHYFGHLLISDI